MIDNTKYNVAHIGGRSGSTDFPKNIKLQDSINLMIFEPDKTCTQQIQQANPNAKIYDYCLDKSEKQRKFYLYKNRFMSSFLESSETKLDLYQEIDGMDMSIDEAQKIDKITKLQTKTIDQLISSKKINEINYISLDTQGSELDILKGASQNLVEKIISIKLEVSFIEMYKNTCMFKDVDDFLKSMGFLLVDLFTFNSTFKERIPQNFRGKQIPVQGEVLYILDPKKVIFKNDINYKQNLEKIAFTYITFGYIDMAYQALSLIKSKGLNFNSDHSYQKFLSKFFYKIKESNSKLPKLWHENLINNYSIDVSKLDTVITEKYLKKNLLHRALIRFFIDRDNFKRLFKSYLEKHFLKLRYNIICLEKKSFLKFLKRHGFTIAVDAVKLKLNRF